MLAVQSNLANTYEVSLDGKKRPCACGEDVYSGCLKLVWRRT